MAGSEKRAEVPLPGIEAGATLLGVFHGSLAYQRENGKLFFVSPAITIDGRDGKQAENVEQAANLREIIHYCQTSGYDATIVLPTAEYSTRFKGVPLLQGAASGLGYATRNHFIHNTLHVTPAAVDIESVDSRPRFPGSAADALVTALQSGSHPVPTKITSLDRLYAGAQKNDIECGPFSVWATAQRWHNPDLSASELVTMMLSKQCLDDISTMMHSASPEKSLQAIMVANAWPQIASAEAEEDVAPEPEPAAAPEPAQTSTDETDQAPLEDSGHEEPDDWEDEFNDADEYDEVRTMGKEELARSIEGTGKIGPTEATELTLRHLLSAQLPKAPQAFNEFWESEEVQRAYTESRALKQLSPQDLVHHAAVKPFRVEQQPFKPTSTGFFARVSKWFAKAPAAGPAVQEEDWELVEKESLLSPGSIDSAYETGSSGDELDERDVLHSRPELITERPAAKETLKADTQPAASRPSPSSRPK